MISFLIVNWNGGEIFEKCIHSIEVNTSQAGVRNYEIVIVDNNSSDFDGNWLQSKEHIRFFRNKRNEGFAAGTNKCVRMSKGDYLFFLNNDVVLNDRSLLMLMEKLYATNVDAVVPKLKYPDGKLQRSIRGLPSLKAIFFASVGLHLVIKKTDTWFLRNFDYNKMQPVKQPMFSALVLKREVWERVGGMDEKFPLLFNDVDWFHRFHLLNMKCLFVPNADVTHVHGMSVNKHRFKKIFISVKSMVFYLKKYNDFKLKELVALYVVATINLMTRVLREILILLKK